MTQTKLTRLRLAEPAPDPNKPADQRIIDYRADFVAADYVSVTRSDAGVYTIKGTAFTTHSDGATSWVEALAAEVKPDGLGGVVSGLALGQANQGHLLVGQQSQSAQTPVPPRHGHNKHGGKR